MDLVPLDEQRQLFISPSIDEWKSIEDHGITAVIDLDGDLDLGIPKPMPQWARTFSSVVANRAPSLATAWSLFNSGRPSSKMGK